MGKEYIKTNKKRNRQKLNWKKRKFNLNSNISNLLNTFYLRSLANKANLN